MMSTYPSTLQKPDHFDLYSRKFRAICEMHSIKTGSREDLEGFLEKLESDRRFAMDFWSLTGKFSAREGGELSDDQILALIVESITGSPLPSNDLAMDPALSLLRAMLAGVDVQRPDTSTSARTTQVAPIDEARSRLASIDELRQKRFSAGLASVQQPADSEPIPPPLPSQLQLALQSLEIVSRELNENFHKIDQRLTGLEVKVKKQTSQANATAPILRDTSQKPPTRPRLSLDPAALIKEERRVFETYPSQRDINWKKNVTVGVVILTAMAAGLSWKYYSTSVRKEIATLVQEDLATPPGSIWHRDTRPPALLPPLAQLAPPAQVSTSSPSPQNVFTPPVEGSKSELDPKQSPNRTEARVEQAITNPPGAIKVASAEMEKRLITSRVPIYPETARREGVEGTVIAQALISKYGAVIRVHVIAGDPRLLSAATQAIFQRRYRPYLLEGQPVEVATTITVNFKLNG
jgi:Gram-negative bacterial TonB protein C-terminal